MTYGGLGRNPYEEREPPEKEPKVPPIPPEEPTLPPIPPQGVTYTVDPPSLPAGYGQPATLSLMPDFEFVGTEYTLRSDDYKIYYEDKEVGRVKADTGEFVLDDPGFLWKAWIPSLKDRLYLSQTGQVPPEAFGGTPLKVQQQFSEWLYTPKKIGETDIPAPATILSAIGAVGTIGVAGYYALQGAYQIGMTASLKRNLHSWAKSAGVKIPKETEYFFVKQAVNQLSKKFMAKEAIKTLFRPTRAGFTLTDAGVKVAETGAYDIVRQSPLLLAIGSSPTTAKVLTDITSAIIKQNLSAPQITAAFIAGFVPSGITLEVTPSLIAQLKDLGHTEAAVSAMKPEEAWANLFKAPVTPEVAPPAVPPVKPPTGIKYVFNLKKFRFEPQAVEIKPGISPEADKLTNLVKAAKPVRELTEALKHEELSKRVGAAAATAKATGAQKAAFAAMAKLKGQLPTATFTPPEAGLTEGEIAALYNQVKSKLLVGDQKFFKWLNTDAALRKLLAGNIPTRGEIELLEGMFGPELAGAILAKRPLNEKIWEATVDILNIPRAILASFDFSAWLRQGAFIVTGYPPIGAKALAIDLRTFFSGKYTAEIDTAIHAGKFAQLREDSGLYLAPVEEGVAVKLAAREETFMSRLVKKIPIVGIGVRLSERAYLSTLNYMRASTFDYYAAKWEKMDYPMKTYKQLADLINWATGRGPIGKLGNMVPVINSVFFAARLQTSRIGMLFAGPAKFTSPPVRRAYIRMMLAFFGSMSAIVALLELTDVATTNTDPRSTDFGKIRIGNTRLDPWAGFRPIITVLAQAITGQRKTATERIQDVSRQETLLRFLRSKYAPAMGLVTDILKGETYLGEEMTLETESLREQFYQRLTPLFIQDMIDSINEDGWMGGVVASPGVLGIGVVTYPGSIDAYERHVVDIPEDMLQDWQRGIILSGEPLTYQNLNVVQKSWLIRHCEAIGDIPERKEPGQFNFYEAERETREELETKLNEEIEPVITGLLQGEITIADYITQSDHLRNKYFGTAAYMWRDSMREKLDPLLHKNLEKWHEEEIKPSDKAYEEYMEFRTNPPTKAGVPDWDAWADNLKGFLSQQTPEIRDYIESRRQSWIDNLPPERQTIERLIVICEKALDDYYAQPEGKERTTYREQNPDVDVKLNLLGRITTVRSNSALVGLAQWADEWGIPYSSIPALAEGPPEAPPREEGLGPNPFE